MTIKEVYEKYKHLDGLLSDSDWLPTTFQGQAIFDLWQAIKEAQPCPHCEGFQALFGAHRPGCPNEER